MVLPAQKAALGSSLQTIFPNQPIKYVPCLCDVKGYIAQGKQILIDEDLEYSKAVLKLSEDLKAFNQS
jgi:hypothetical protein